MAGRSGKGKWSEGRVEPDRCKGSRKTMFRRRLGSELWVGHRWPWIQAKVPLRLAASLLGDVLRGVDTCQLTHPPVELEKAV